MSSDEHKDTMARQEEFRRKTVKAMIEIAFVFGVPAFVALFIGKRLDATYGTGKMWLLISLAVAFVSSWIVVIRMYVRLSKEARKVDDSVGKMREEQGKDKKPVSDEDDESTSMIL